MSDTKKPDAIDQLIANTAAKKRADEKTWQDGEPARRALRERVASFIAAGPKFREVAKKAMAQQAKRLTDGGIEHFLDGGVVFAGNTTVHLEPDDNEKLERITWLYLTIPDMGKTVVMVSMTHVDAVGEKCKGFVHVYYGAWAPQAWVSLKRNESGDPVSIVESDEETAVDTVGKMIARAIGEAMKSRVLPPKR